MFTPAAHNHARRVSKFDTLPSRVACLRSSFDSPSARPHNKLDVCRQVLLISATDFPEFAGKGCQMLSSNPAIPKSEFPCCQLAVHSSYIVVLLFVGIGLSSPNLVMSARKCLMLAHASVRVSESSEDAIKEITMMGNPADSQLQLPVLEIGEVRFARSVVLFLPLSKTWVSLSVSEVPTYHSKPAFITAQNSAYRPQFHNIFASSTDLYQPPLCLRLESAPRRLPTPAMQHCLRCRLVHPTKPATAKLPAHPPPSKQKRRRPAVIPTIQTAIHSISRCGPAAQQEEA